MKCGAEYINYGASDIGRPCHCERARHHIGACGPKDAAGGKTVISDPDAPSLPFGCIEVGALVELARAMIRLDMHHVESGGAPADRPCLRRLESASGSITAHISTGPAVGGSWERLELVRGKWEQR